MVIYQTSGEGPSMHNSGERSRIRTAAASSFLDHNTKLVLRQTKCGYELYANGIPSPVKCETWPQARRILLGLGVPYQGIDEISVRLTEGKGLIIRRRA
jgi:hypothetical protein